MLKQCVTCNLSGLLRTTASLLFVSLQSCQSCLLVIETEVTQDCLPMNIRTYLVKETLSLSELPLEHEVPRPIEVKIQVDLELLRRRSNGESRRFELQSKRLMKCHECH